MSLPRIEESHILLLYLPRIGESHSIAPLISSYSAVFLGIVSILLRPNQVIIGIAYSSIVPSKDRGVAFHRAAHQFLFRRLSRNGLYTSTPNSTDHIDMGVRRDSGDSFTVPSKDRGV